MGSTKITREDIDDSVFENIDFGEIDELVEHMADTANPHGVTPEQIGALPVSAITYGTTDLEAGVSDLAPGTVYFVYE